MIACSVMLLDIIATGKSRVPCAKLGAPLRSRTMQPAAPPTRVIRAMARSSAVALSTAALAEQGIPVRRP